MRPSQSLLDPRRRALLLASGALGTVLHGHCSSCGAPRSEPTRVTPVLDALRWAKAKPDAISIDGPCPRCPSQAAPPTRGTVVDSLTINGGPNLFDATDFDPDLDVKAEFDDSVPCDEESVEDANAAIDDAVRDSTNDSLPRFDKGCEPSAVTEIPLGSRVTWTSGGKAKTGILIYAGPLQSTHSFPLYYEGNWSSLEHHEAAVRAWGTNSYKPDYPASMGIIVMMERTGKSGQPLAPWFYAPYPSQISLAE